MLRRSRYIYCSMVPLLYFLSLDSKCPPSILTHNSALGLTSLKALLTSAGSREATKSLTTSMRSSRVSGLTLLTSASHIDHSQKSHGAWSGLWAGQGMSVLPEMICSPADLDRIVCSELRPRGHLKWHLNMTNGKICWPPELEKLSVGRNSRKHHFKQEL